MSQSGVTPTPSAPSVTRNPPGVALIAAMTTDSLIGAANRLPWKLSADMRRFRALTLGQCTVMGRRTYESIGAPLPKRRNVVVSRSGFAPAGCAAAASLADGIACCGAGERVLVIGGGVLYRDALPLAGRIYLTLIEPHERKLPLFDPFEGDAWFPAIPPAEWAIERLGRRNAARPKGRPAPPALRSIYFRFIDLVRVAPPATGPAPDGPARFDPDDYTRLSASTRRRGLPAAESR